MYSETYLRIRFNTEEFYLLLSMEVIIMLKHTGLFFGLLLVIVLAGCQQAAPLPASVQATATPVTPTPDISSPLIGTYTTTITGQDIVDHPELDTGDQKGNAGGMALRGIWTLIYRSDGIWIAQDNNEYGRQYIGTGHFSVSDHQVMLLTDSKCLEYYVPYYGVGAQFATYTWQLNGTTLTLRTASDLCTPRHIVLASHPWNRVR